MECFTYHLTACSYLSYTGLYCRTIQYKHVVIIPETPGSCWEYAPLLRVFKVICKTYIMFWFSNLQPKCTNGMLPRVLCKCYSSITGRHQWELLHLPTLQLTWIRLTIGKTCLLEKSAVELDDVRAFIAAHDDVQVHQQLLLLALIHRRPYPLHNSTPNCQSPLAPQSKWHALSSTILEH